MTRRTAIVTSVVLLALGLLSCTGGSPEEEGGERLSETAEQPRAERPSAERAQSPVNFFREYVTVEPSEGRTRVVGDYYFRNESGRALDIGIHYPFPVDRFHLYPFRVAAWEERDGAFRPIGFTHTADGVDWRMRFDVAEERLVRVEYVQEIKRSHAIYIVTTTKEWGRPIELAEFEFRIPRDLGEVELSFVPDREEIRGDTLVYYMARTEFLPDTDLTVTWE